ncbi:MAG TPA: cupredoxin domain-containing protein [Symbiobacteriaceae bacterium]|nr:cupredoxin domain-containing protein [Symbiobacteriaceae bacterium]
MKKVLILAIVAVLSLGLLAACGGGGGGATHKLEVVAGENGEMKYTPDTLSVKKGETVEVTLVNKDSAQAHSFILAKYNVKTKQVQPGQKETVKFVAKDAGDLTFECDVPGHKDGGMVGKITVTQ